ncbi:tRNA uracil 4-sulfurtransferase ThiI [Candidatus Providencia siddallii]|uniref:tRNA sulfurtransferase n=1 Tax=Candidatus Providencia siddallii TaxID=1715285 RepID=A0ABM9NPE6_9GAMM
MNFIIKLFSEITIKSKSVRLYFIRTLTNNINNILKKISKEILVVRKWDYIEVYIYDLSKYDKICDELTRIPGINYFLEVEKKTFLNLDDIFKEVYSIYSIQLKNKTFCVRVKRKGKHKFSSIEAESYIGFMLNNSIKSSIVKLKNQDITIHLEIKDNILFIVKSRFNGIGGFPIGTQENVLSLISGGIDSCVSSYMLIRRGCCVHYCFFNIGNIEYEIKVKEIAYYLWKRFGSTHNVKFFIIDFKFLVSEIIKKVKSDQISIILKRMMIKAASKIAKHYNIQAIATGESLGQVSSQTIINLNIINNISSLIVLRPLIAYDKEVIIEISRKIGTEKFTKNIPEYCTKFLKKQTAKAIQSSIETEENKIDYNILDVAIKSVEYVDFNQFFFKKIKVNLKVEVVNKIFSKNEIILDIRTIDEYKTKPLFIKGVEIKHIPFYKLNTQFPILPKNKTYLLYCERGIMSRLQALILNEKGFFNIKIYRP